MPIPLRDLASRLDPTSTVLFLGSGASVESGGKTADALARALSQSVAKEDPFSSDLMELSTYLEDEYGRPKLIQALRAEVASIRATGAILALPEYEWPAIYTTNYDTAVEQAYRSSGRNITVVASDVDYGRLAVNAGTPLFKLHGCITKDLVDGHSSRIVITEADYDTYLDFRDNLFARFALDLANHDVLFLGHSLNDAHLRSYVKKAEQVRERAGIIGRIYVLQYSDDVRRARLIERFGTKTATGALDAFLAALTATHEAKPGIPLTESSKRTRLPVRLRPVTIEVQHAEQMAPNVTQLYNGTPASYADIHAGLTFERLPEPGLLAGLRTGQTGIVGVTGLAGVGKSTLARRVLKQLSDEGALCYEHKNALTLDDAEWIAAERQLLHEGRWAVLLVDDCTSMLRSVNRLADYIGHHDGLALRLVVTASRPQWGPRQRSRHFFGPKAKLVDLGQLASAEIRALLTLLARSEEISRLVDHEFLALDGRQRFETLRDRCGADMFVCLRNIFANQQLDVLLLQEFAQLDAAEQDVYRLVAMLEAAGSQPHRQLVLRLLNVETGHIAGLLRRLGGLVEETEVTGGGRRREEPEVDRQYGYYIWHTRHTVIAHVIAHYKYARPAERYELFLNVIEGLNPAVYLEFRLANELCDSEFGIGNLPSQEMQLSLYRTLIKRVPGARVPRHRLIRVLLDREDTPGAATAIADAVETVGLDSPLVGYKVKLALKRAFSTEGISDGDRVAMIYQADEAARLGVDRFPDNKYSYRSRLDVGEALGRLKSDCSLLDEALEQAEQAIPMIGDPQLSGWVSEVRSRRVTRSSS